MSPPYAPRYPPDVTSDNRDRENGRTFPRFQADSYPMPLSGRQPEATFSPLQWILDLT
jgi:hypothetical protein